MKKLAKRHITAVLGWQVRRLQKKKNFKVVAVAGSVGKTSTKLAIARTLSALYKVQYQDGNYNDPVSVPLVFFGRKMPSIYNVFAWKLIFLKNELQLRKKYPYDVVVVELGTDYPGTIGQFKEYLRADIGIVTAIAPEHMEYFKDLQAVAEEELSIAEYSDLLLVNTDMTDNKFLEDIRNRYVSYGKNGNYEISKLSFDTNGTNFQVVNVGKSGIKVNCEAFSGPQIHSLLAAISVANIMGLSEWEIGQGLKKIKPVAGRMQLLKGHNGSTIIDDTYNASPEAVLAALETLYRLPAKQKIAVLGNMNELGKYSAEEHTKIGKHCDPRKLDLVITIGPDANKYLAAAAKKRGCKVELFNNPYDAGNFIKDRIEKDSLILVKGSQNKVFAEEVVKVLLADQQDAAKLVRQSSKWMAVKKKNFA